MTSSTNEPPATTRLPRGWEQAESVNGPVYYIDHNTHTTTFARPTNQPESPTGDAKHVLPAGWEQRETPSGRVYLIDHNTHTNTWNDPRSEDTHVDGDWEEMLPREDSPLPAGCEIKTSATGRPYFVNNNSKLTTWDDPRIQNKQ